MTPAPDPEAVPELDAALRLAVRCALATTDFATALAHFGQALPEAAPHLLAQLPPGDAERRALCFAILREVWNRAPRPDYDWRPLGLAKPERNAPCPCGSGRKYKQCCGALADSGPFGDEGLSVLSYVLEEVPADQYKNLPFRKFSPEELGHVADQWLEAGRSEATVALLEPLLADAARLDGRHEYAFDMLCDAYLELGRGDRRVALVERLMQCADRDLRSAAMHRRCTMSADEGDYPAAWRLFKAAQLLDPDHPSLAHLEVVLLVGQGDIDQAQNRARFWAARLRRLGHGDEEIVALMDEIAADPSAFVAAFNEQGGALGDGLDAATLLKLAALMDALPAPARHYRLRPAEGSAGPLRPGAALASLEAAWREVFWGDDERGSDDDDADDPWADTGWLDWLADFPLAWQSFAVVEDLLAAIDELPCESDELCDALDAIEETLLAHAVALLRLNMSDNGADGCTLEWGWSENRPALRLLAQAIDLAAAGDEELPLVEWLVLDLNPNDNQGLRERLVHLYAGAGRAADALAVCDLYPDDILGGMDYGRILALYLLDRRGDAVAALAAAKERRPRILKTLVAARPRQPELQDGVMRPGGEDEAWYYRQNWRALWQRTGALDWLRRVSGVKA